MSKEFMEEAKKYFTDLLVEKLNGLITKGTENPFVVMVSSAPVDMMESHGMGGISPLFLCGASMIPGTEQFLYTVVPVEEKKLADYPTNNMRELSLQLLANSNAFMKLATNLRALALEAIQQDVKSRKDLSLPLPSTPAEIDEAIRATEEAFKRAETEVSHSIH